MADLTKHPTSGIYYFRREVPEDIRHIIGKREWKVSLKTRELSEARPRFAHQQAKCEDEFRRAREQLAGRVLIVVSDAPKLADRWMNRVIAGWAQNPSLLTEFLASSGADKEAASDYVDIESEADALRVVGAYIEATLKDAGIPLPPKDDPVSAVLLQEFLRNWTQLCNLAVFRVGNDWRTMPEQLAANEPLTFELSNRKTKSPRLSEVLEKWAADKLQTDGDNRSTNKTVSEFRMPVTRFIELLGDLPVGDITRSICHDFREALGKLPASGDGVRRLNAPAAIAKAEAEDLPRLSLATVKKQLRAVSAVLNFASQRLGVIAEDPIAASGMLRTLSKAARRADKKDSEDKPYRRAELTTIFSSPLFRSEWRPAQSDFGEALYWLPLLMAYTGARREELAQLLVGDVRQDEETQVWYLTIKPSADASVKTLSSRRKVPLHSDLLELGLLEYRSGLNPDGRLFPKLKAHPANGYGYSVGKAWAGYLRKVVKLNSSAAPSHGFRHSFKTLCREVGIPTDVQDWIVGHSSGTVGETYGINPLQRMSQELVKFPSLARMAGLLPPLPSEHQ
jgi:integrase